MNLYFSASKSSYYKYIILFIGIALWVSIPILGIFTLLLFVLINHNSKPLIIDEYLNKFILLLVIITVSLFCSLIDIHTDTKVYLEVYQKCALLNPIECIESEPFPFEPGFYFLSYIFYFLSDGSDFAFLLFWSLIINTLMIFVICQGLSKRYYALISIFILLNPSFYIQTFLMRQFLATTLFLCALILNKNKIICIILLLLSIFNHYSMLLYLSVIVLVFLTKNIKTESSSIYKIRNYFIIILYILGIISSADNSIIANVFELVSNIPYLGFLADKLQYFLNPNLASVSFKIHLIPLGFLTLFYLNKSTLIQNKYNLNLSLFLEYEYLDRSMFYLYFLQLFLLLFTRKLEFLPLRLTMLLLSYTGAFFYIALENKVNIKPRLKFFCLTCLTIFWCFSFGMFLHNISISNNSLNYLEGNPFTTSIIDYIDLAISRW